VVEGVALLLMQKGLGIHAAKVSLQWGGLWTLVTLIFQVLIYYHVDTLSYVFSMIWQSMLLVFYACLWLLPQKNLFRRPAVIFYARSWCLFRLLCMLASTLVFINDHRASGQCLYVIGTLFPFAIFEPLLLYYTLLQDSRWWQGQNIFQGRRVAKDEEIRSPLAGIDINLLSAQTLAASMDK
jgi:hypothetical protein